MAEKKARHAFGNLADVQNAINDGKVNEFDILFLDGDTEPKIGWIDRNGVFRLVQNEADFSELEAVIATKADATDVEALETEMATKVTAEEVDAKIADKADISEVETLKTEVANKADVSTVQSMIEEHSSSVIEVVEF